MTFTRDVALLWSVSPWERLKGCIFARYSNALCSRWASCTGRSSYVAWLAALCECQAGKRICVDLNVGVLKSVRLERKTGGQEVLL